MKWDNKLCQYILTCDSICSNNNYRIYDNILFFNYNVHCNNTLFIELFRNNRTSIAF